MGRPSDFTPELGDAICALVPFESVAAICRREGMPDESTFYRWKRAHPEFREQYAHAREDRAHVKADRLDELNEQVRRGEIEPAAARVIADNEKWIMARMAPKDLGDRQVIAGDKDAPLHPPTDSRALAEELVAALEAAEKARGG